MLANKESGVFDSYGAILHRGFNINDERRLDVEARVLNPRRAKGEKDILSAIQEWRQDQMLLVEVGYVHSHGLLRESDGRMAQTILIKMMPSDGKNSIQKHFREHLSKAKSYDELKEKLHAELFRRDAENHDKKDGGFNQVEEGPESTEAADEKIWMDVWYRDHGWIQALAPAAERPRKGKGYKAGKGNRKNGKGKTRHELAMRSG